MLIFCKQDKLERLELLVFPEWLEAQVGPVRLVFREALVQWDQQGKLVQLESEELELMASLVQSDQLVPLE